MPLLFDESKCVKSPLEILDLCFQLFLFASDSVRVELSLGDRFEVSSRLFLSPQEETAVVWCPIVFAAARKNCYLKQVIKPLSSVSDVVLYLPSIEKAFLLIKIIQYNDLSTSILHSMACDGEHDQYLLIGVLPDLFGKTRDHLVFDCSGSRGVKFVHPWPIFVYWSSVVHSKPI